ncbi:thylakoid membrane protein [Chloropicon roscoffensis]|uniref:Thylakoid membrane protein n=1 Tax=Chloropicon roscoffensis TaxID=1461544 RepID=A0AAX4PD68_9CHLO|mmetsp:Transcript_9378/g.28482  ORF Transcript_9378/g.28482 Transcript_9378/m.28482 type:complete len:313 (-) Transcript_9378:71-1009(-)
MQSTTATTTTTTTTTATLRRTAGAASSRRARPAATSRHPRHPAGLSPLGLRGVGGRTRSAQELVRPRASPLDDLFGGSDAAEANLPDAQGFIDGSAGAFTITKVSFGSIALYTGTALLAYGFGAYFDFLPGTDFSAIMLIYGFPASLIGFALKYAQLDPVPCRSKPEAIPLRAAKATDIQNQIREDVTRYRYGDEQHLDLALERILMIGRYGGVPRKFVPELVQIREEVRDGEYALVLEFKHKGGFKGSDWGERLEKVTSFFGPGIRDAELVETEQGAEITLTSDGSGEGISGEEKGEVLPPLMPGLAPREQ